MMRLSYSILASCLILAAATAAPAKHAADKSPVETLAPLPIPDIAYSKFVLANGLTLLVHEDHKAPIVAVNIWYHVGSKNEPQGRTGFAHLFEHLMFGGKNGNQKGWFEKMEALGATDLNGTTYYDRTNFFETVPVGALDTALYLEANRMGHLLDDFNEAILTTQRGVVQNEKRQGENEPYAVSDELITKSVWPASHPYSHTVIGEMTDLEAAKVADVKDWFSKYYGPTNAVIAISGDITAAEAKAKVEQYFGAIPPGPPVPRQKAWIAKRTGSQRATAEDHVTLAKFYKVWNIPGYGAADADHLNLLSDILTTDKDSRLYRRLVYRDKIATEVNSYVDAREVGGLFQIEITAKPGVSLDRIEAACNEEMARLLKDGPTAEEVERARTRNLSNAIRQLERVGGFGGTSDILAESEAYTGSPDAWKARLEHIRTATPAQLLTAGRHWLTDGDFTLHITPFGNYAASGKPAAVPDTRATESKGLGKLERAKLANGLNVVVVERHATPTVSMSLILDAGFASDQAIKPGTATLAAAVLHDGTANLDALALAERTGLLGVRLGSSVGNDFTDVRMSVLNTRLDPALDLFADVVLHPAYRAEDVAREKALAVAEIQRAKDSPVDAAVRILPSLIYGGGHAYGQLRTEASVAALTPDDLKRYHAAWFQPQGATLVVVGDTSLKQVLPKIEARFGAWKPVAHPAKNIGPVPSPAQPVVYLLDKPDAGQSVLLATETAPSRVNPDDIAIRTVNTVLGGAFTSRLNMNLREDKHWSYGAFSFLDDAKGPSAFIAYASVQADKTVEAFNEMQKEFADIIAARPVTPDELVLAKGNLSRSLPGQWETNAAVAGSVAEIVGYGLPDDYYDSYSARIGAVTGADAARAAKAMVRPGAMVWLIVGDRIKVEPALKAKGVTPVLIDGDGKPVK
jgi:zinc protease